MRTPRADWSRWAGLLRRWGVQDLAAWALDAAGPLTILGAQVLYLVQPFVRKDAALRALAQMLEDDHDVRAFVAYLQQERGR